ncbi:hypothetical protein L7F22_008213 [Adiantum nelumboides]|nr:hypothetical protein [Adiantum nelumboides]
MSTDRKRTCIQQFGNAIALPQDISLSLFQSLICVYILSFIFVHFRNWAPVYTNSIVGGVRHFLKWARSHQESWKACQFGLLYICVHSVLPFGNGLLGQLYKDLTLPCFVCWGFWLSVPCSQPCFMVGQMGYMRMKVVSLTQKAEANDARDHM